MVLRASYALPEPIGADAIVTVPVDAAVAELSGELTSYEPPLLALTSVDASQTQRLTGLETISREDHAVDSASKMFYGMDQD
ncbi:hypothetical protein [Actinomyces sp.]|uniref:hypothetical protein n=1 Tax=Actinomyces sp. TaxID=29317 RepID=UPI0026DACED4|nr:hypothetical protein [Actinomyces sp.]MDO4899305.1 hypothetical protein [Actinomyces sp.]